MMNLKFGTGNAKLTANIATFSLPAGHACPFAKDCRSCTDKFTGKITDGENIIFRCFSATNEARATSVRFARWHNFDALKKAKTVKAMAELINRSLPIAISHVRVHVSGDFFNENYFKAWMNVAAWNSNVIFYAYTKALPIWVKYRSQIPSNLRIVASYGGTHDHLIKKHNLPSAIVVFSEEQAENINLPIDHDDSHAIAANHNFALLLHATQPQGTPAAEAWSRIKRLVGGYSRGKKRNHSPTTVETKELVFA